MKTLLLCGYHESTEQNILGLNRDDSERTLIDRRIQEIKRLGFEIICVFGGKYADEQLRQTMHVADTELVYDTSDTISLASNIKAGLAATDGESCYVIPVEIQPPPLEYWHGLYKELRNKGFLWPVSMLQGADIQGAPSHYGFPLLITRKGSQTIRDLSGFHSLLDSRLTYQHVVVSSVERGL